MENKRTPKTKAKVLYGDPIPPVLKTKELQPCPSTLIKAVEQCSVPLPGGLLIVGSTSPKQYREAVEELGSYFCRELRYDNRPYCAWEHKPPAEYCTQPKTDEELRAFLFLDPEVSHQRRWQTFGAACFRLRRFKDKNSIWIFAWAWLHAAQRRRNHLTRVWPFFKAMFGEFAIQEPLSRDMMAFLLKMQPDGYLGAK